MAWRATTVLMAEAKAASAWSLSIRGETSAFRPDYLDPGFECTLRVTEQQIIDAVADVARRRREYLNENQIATQDDVALKNVLICNPSNSFFTSLAADWTSGFFDSNDLPPSGFWIGNLLNDDEEKNTQFDVMLVSYIAPKFREIFDEASPTWFDGFACWGTDIEGLCLPEDELVEVTKLVTSAFSYA